MPRTGTNRITALLFGLGLLAFLSVGGILWYAAIRGTETSVPSAPPDASGSASIKLTWDRSPNERVTGYRILFGTQSRSYTNSLEVGNEPTATLKGLREGTRYYVVVIAVDAEGNQSPPSNELEITPAK